MGLGGEPAEAEPSSVEEILDAWRERLLRICCVFSGGALFLGLIAFWLMTGAPIPGFHASWPLALAIMGLPWMGRGLVRFRALAYTALLASMLGILGCHLGWAPGNVALSSFLVVAAGLLLNSRAGYGFLALQAIAFCIGGEAVRRGALHIDGGFLEITQPNNWLRVAIVFALLGFALWALLRSVTNLIEHALAQASTSRALAERQLAVSRALRQARLGAELELRGPQKLQALGQLAGGLAHLLNNELTVIAGALHDLDRDSSVSTRRDVSARIVQAVSRAAATIQQMLIFSRREELAAKELDLAVEVSKIVEELRPTIGSDVLIASQGVDGHVMRIEPTRLRLMLLNLLLNAVDALPSGGRVLVSVRADSSRGSEPARLSLIIEDTGDGMSADVLARACDTFFTTRDRAQHAGLGLSVAASIAEQSNGLLTIESAPQIGTRVQVSWPTSGASETAPQQELSLLHPALLNPAPAHETSEARLDREPAIDIGVERWKTETVVRLARIGALSIAGVFCAAFLFTPQSPVGYFLAGGLVLLSNIVAGWMPRLSRNARLVLLFVPFTLSIGLTLGWFSFRGGAIVAAMSMVLVWAAMLGPWWAGLATLAWFVAMLVLGGQLHAARLVATDPALTSMAVASNWIRVGVSLSAVQSGMLASVAIIVRRAAQAIASMTEAKRRAVHAQQQEEEEGGRALLLEQEATRVARMSVSGTAAGTVAHDLNNALQALSLATLLDSERLTAERVQTIARDLRLAAHYCAALVGLVGQDPSAPSEPRAALDVSAALKRISELLPSFIDSRVVVRVEIEPACWAVLGASDLQRILLNLAANARDAMPAAGTLHISLRRDGDHVRLDVSDTGVGMDEAVRARVFEPFFTTKPAGKGTGLGLHAVARIVQETAGTIACESQAGVGTTFTLRWPRAEPERSDERPEAVSSGERGPGRILVAEDQPLVREVMVRALNALGFDVAEASDGNLAMTLVESDVPWTALCVDGVMPGRATADVIQVFAARHPHRPVLLCSGHLPQELTRRGLRDGGVILVSKPFSPSDLQRALMNALAETESRSAARAAAL